MSNPTFTLNQAKKGAKVVITSVSDHPLIQRLGEMGVFPGLEVRVLHRAPFQGSIAIEILGYRLALRIQEAQLITVASC
jgi:Fe2+ transport system protein FeoA